MLHKLKQLTDRITRPHRRHLRAESSVFDQRVITSTNLWRNAAQLRVLATRILPRLAQLAEGPVKVGIHAGSIGCEAASLVIAADHYGFKGNLEVHSFDIDPDAIAIARSGVIEPRHLADPADPTKRLLPPLLAKHYLREQADGRLQIIDDVRNRIRCNVCDVTDAAMVRDAGRFHLLLCQNALVHLTEAAATQAVANLLGQLPDYGILALGGTQPDQLEAIAGRFKLHPVEADDQKVYDGWSNRQRLWRNNPESHLGMEPYDPHHAARQMRYGHLFTGRYGEAFWRNFPDNQERLVA